MSGISVTSTSTFGSMPSIGRSNDTDWYQENGIDPSLVKQLSGLLSAASSQAPTNGKAVVQAYQNFLNSLTPAQLKTNAPGVGAQGSDNNGVHTGWDNNRIYTWQDLKDYMNTSQALYDRIAQTDPNDPAAKPVLNLLNGLINNTPGALHQATQYLAATSSDDTVSLSPAAKSVLAASSTSVAGIASPPAEQSLGTPASDSGAAIALAMLTAIDSSTKETKPPASSTAPETLVDAGKPRINLVA